MGKSSKANQMHKSTNIKDSNNGRLESFSKPNRKFQLALQGLDKQSVKSKLNDPKVLQVSSKISSKQNLSFANGNSDSKSNSSLTFPQAESKDKISFLRSGSSVSSERTPVPISFNNLFNSQISFLKENKKERSSPDRPSSLSFVRSQKESQGKPLSKNSFERTKEERPLSSRNSQEVSSSPDAHRSLLSRKSTTIYAGSSQNGEYEPKSKLLLSDFTSKNSSRPRHSSPDDNLVSSQSIQKSSVDYCHKNSFSNSIREKNGKNGSSHLAKDVPSQENFRTSRESSSTNILSRLGTSKRKKSASPTREYKEAKTYENGAPDHFSKLQKVNPLSSRLGPLPRIFSEDRNTAVENRSVYSRVGSNKVQHNEESAHNKNLKASLPPLRFNMSSGKISLPFNPVQDFVGVDPLHKSYIQPLDSRPFSQPISNSPRFINKFDLVRCAFFPNCTRSGCLYFHPQEDCPNGELCSDVDSGCLFIHPSDKKPKMCRFDVTCNRSDCPYEHLNRKITVEKPDSFIPIPCKTIGCSDLSCLFVHPNQQLPFSKAPCIFGARCNRFPCDRFHSSLYRSRALPKNNPLLLDIKKAYLSVFDHLVFESEMI